MLRTLIDFRANVNAAAGPALNKATALHLAAHKGSHAAALVFCLRVLSCSRWDCGCVNVAWSETLAPFLPSNHLPSLHQILITAGANVNSHDGNGATPLDVATSRGHDSVASLLAEHGGTTNDGPHTPHPVR